MTNSDQFVREGLSARINIWAVAAVALITVDVNADVTWRGANFDFPVEDSHFHITNGLPYDGEGNPLDSGGYLIVEGAGTSFETLHFEFDYTTHFVNGFRIPPYIHYGDLVVANGGMYNVNGDLLFGGNPYIWPSISVTGGGRLTTQGIYASYDLEGPRGFNLTVSGGGRLDFDFFDLYFVEDFSFSSYQYNEYFGSSEDFNINILSGGNLIGSQVNVSGDFDDLTQTVINVSNADWEVDYSYLYGTTVNLTSNADVIGVDWYTDSSAVHVSNSVIEAGTVQSYFDWSYEVLNSEINASSVSFYQTNVTFESSTIAADYLSIEAVDAYALDTDFVVTGLFIGSDYLFGVLGTTTFDTSTVESERFNLYGGEFIANDSSLAATDIDISGAIAHINNTPMFADRVTVSGAELHLNGSSIAPRSAGISSADVEVWAGGTLDLMAANLGRLYVDESSQLRVGAGVSSVGDGSAPNAFRVDGVTTVFGGTLDISSYLTPARLGIDTQIEDGTIQSNTGFFLPSTSLLRGYGQVNGPLVAALGSTISASGDLEIGDETALDGFFSEGNLYVNNNTVRIQDANRAVLGSLTEIGNSEGSGTLIAENGILIDFGRNLAGYGAVVGDILNNGFIQGSGPGPGDVLDLQGLVTGVGDYAGTVLFSGGFSPGLSPTIIDGENFIFDSLLVMEIGGLIPGDEHDQIRATGSIQFGGVLEIVFLDDFVPSVGDTFMLFMAEEIVGTFDDVILPSLPPGISWGEFFTDPSGGLSLGVTSAVPLPPALWLLAAGLIGLRKLAKPLSGQCVRLVAA